jgi:LacI family transcriptional regulator
MVAGAIEAADARGYTLKILSFDSLGASPQQVIRRCAELRLMGVLALHLPPSALKELHFEAKSYGYPLVLLDIRSETLEMPEVTSDDEQGIDTGVAHLVGLGHTRIAFLSSVDTDSPIAMTRENAFIKSMERRQLTIAPHYIGRGSVREREVSVRAASRLLRLPPKRRPTAIFCSSDVMAMVTLQVAAELGVVVPRECSVLGYANLDFCEYSIPQLTTIEQPFADMGRVAAETLLAAVQLQIDQAEAPIAEPPAGRLLETETEIDPCICIRLPTRLVERSSTAPPVRS